MEQPVKIWLVEYSDKKYILDNIPANHLTIIFQRATFKGVGKVSQLACNKKVNHTSVFSTGDSFILGQFYREICSVYSQWFRSKLPIVIMRIKN